jgi:hypothetical protein
MSKDIEDESLFNLNETDKAILSQEMYWFQRAVCVSDAVRRECEADLEKAKQNKYRFKE